MSPQGSQRPVDPGALLRRERDRALLRDGAVALVAVAALVVTWAVRTVPNPDHPEAVLVTERMDDAYRAIRDGTVSLTDTASEVAEGITGARIDRSVGDPRWVLTGTAGRDCYVLWWDPSGLRRARTLSQRVACEPSLSATSSDPDAFGRVGRGTPEAEARSPWVDVLPERELLRVWVIPAMILGGGVLLSALVRMTIALLTGRAPSWTRR